MCLFKMLCKMSSRIAAATAETCAALATARGQKLGNPNGA